MTTDNEGLLSRWSRRKLQAKEITEQEDDQLELNQQSALGELEADDTENPFTEAVETEPVLTDADMPDIDTLHEDSDFTPFMSPGVSDRLRNLALKKMFHAPVFNIRDGLDEYDDDYTSFEALGDIVTCDMKHQMELEAQKKLENELEDDDVYSEEIEGKDVNELEPESDEADESDIDSTETDITETDITEPFEQLDEQHQSTAASKSGNSKNTAENN